MSRVLGCLVTTSLLFLGVGATPATAASSIDYVALGDSYSSGVGAPGQTGSCLRSPYGYPAQWAAAQQPQTFTDLTCSGAQTSDVIATQAPAIPAGTDLVSITIGGNDAGFSSVVTTCQTSTDAACVQRVAQAENDARTTLPGRLDNAYAAIRSAAPSAKVVVLDYPLLFDTSSSSCGATGMSLTKRQALNEGAGVLDGVIAERAEAAGFTFSDVRDEFAGHGICSAAPYLNGLTFPTVNSFHPNRDGYTYGYLPALTASAG
jgi:lysophospholipase L1-like esterase